MEAAREYVEDEDVLDKRRQLQLQLTRYREMVTDKSCGLGTSDQGSAELPHDSKSKEGQHVSEEDQADGPMTTLHKQAIKSNLAVLVENMVPTDVFRHLVAKGILTSAEERRIRAQKTWENMNSQLLDHVLRRSDLAFGVLVESLRDSCQDHLADVLVHSGSKRPRTEEIMSAEHKQAIHQKRVELANDLTPDEILNTLISEKILSVAEVSQINENSTRETKNENLLDYIVRRCDRAFSVFLEALGNTGQEHLSRGLQSSSHRLEQKRKKLKPLNIPASCSTTSDTPVRTDPPTTADVPRPDLINAEHSQVPDGEQESLASTRAQQLSEDSAATSDSCTLDDVKQQIMLMAENVYANIQKNDNSSESFAQFSREMIETTESINESMKVFNMIKDFCDRSDHPGTQS